MGDLRCPGKLKWEFPKIRGTFLGVFGGSQ